jgi:predicted Zn-dependent protease
MRLALILLVTFACSCAASRPAVPVGTIPAARETSTTDEQYGHTVLNELSERFKLDFSDPRYNDVVAIVDRLAAAVNANNSPWHVYLFAEPEIKNAAATRGNHVFVWSGLLDYTNSDDEVATVIAHEIAHVLAGHTDPDPNEEIRKMLLSVGAMAVGIAVTTATRDPTLAQNLGNISASLTQEVGSGFLVNPYSRELEYEADHIGLMIMSAAGYDPNKAIEFWTRAGKDPDFSASIEFFSTHPPAADRLNKLKSALPLAEQYRSGKSLPSMLTSSSNSSLQQNSTILTPTPNNSSALSGTSNFSKEPGKTTGGSDQWRVTSPRAVLYSDRSIQSKPLGELKKGAIIRPITTQRGWLEVQYPDSGFLQGSDLEPLN